MKTKQKTPDLGLAGSIAWAGRLEVANLEGIKAHAKKERRTIAGQLNLAISEWLAGNVARLPQQVHLPQHLAGGVGKFSTPAKPSNVTVPPSVQDKLKEIAYSDEGFEGTDPAVPSVERPKGMQVKMP